jgi:hypothetical protein
MYYAIVIALMFVLPLCSIAFGVWHTGASVSAALMAKWFVFWSVGWRLFLAGARQILQPAYTAKVILGLKGDDSLLLVRELGFANLALGITGIASLFVPSWQLAVALAGGVFYGLAGVNHVLQQHRGRLENVAMLSDLSIAIVLLGAFAGAELWPVRLV